MSYIKLISQNVNIINCILSRATQGDTSKHMLGIIHHNCPERVITMY